VASSPLRLFQRAGSIAAGSAPPYNWQPPDNGKRPPNGHYTPDSAHPDEWPRERQKARNRLLSSSNQHTADMAKWARDDKEKDSFLWGNLSDFKDEDTSEYWDTLCNGTNTSKANPLPGDAMPAGKFNILDAGWKMEQNETCTEFVGKEYADPVEAFMECGPMCDALSDVGCNFMGVSAGAGPAPAPAPAGGSSPAPAGGSSPAPAAATKKLRMCATGGMRKKANSSCTLTKPADFVSPKSLPRPPVETAFWRKFCKYRMKGRHLRIMFEGQNCGASAVKVLGKATNPVECSALAAKDKLCTKVFDFRFGPPSVCRCLKKDADCAPAASAGGHVYAPV